MLLSTMMVCCAAFPCAAPDPQESDARVLFAFDDDDDAERSWRAVNDGVMGGRSSGRFRLSGFHGQRALETVYAHCVDLREGMLIDRYLP
jgi:hypothetical protein